MGEGAGLLRRFVRMEGVEGRCFGFAGCTLVNIPYLLLSTLRGKWARGTYEHIPPILFSPVFIQVIMSCL